MLKEKLFENADIFINKISSYAVEISDSEGKRTTFTGSEKECNSFYESFLNICRKKNVINFDPGFLKEMLLEKEHKKMYYQKISDVTYLKEAADQIESYIKNEEIRTSGLIIWIRGNYMLGTLELFMKQISSIKNAETDLSVMLVYANDPDQSRVDCILLGEPV